MPHVPLIVSDVIVVGAMVETKSVCFNHPGRWIQRISGLRNSHLLPFHPTLQQLRLMSPTD